LPDEVLEREETVALVRTALGRLKSKEQTALRARYIEGLLSRDIARDMGITEKAVHSLLYRARISLRRELKRTASLYDKGQYYEAKK
jgi:RNA polymerase sigma factor (sigma-70 family)